MKREFSLILALLLALNLAACGGNAGQAPGVGLSDPPSHAEAAPAASTGADLPEEDAAAPAAEPDGRALRVTVGGQTFLARLDDSGAARALAERLPLTLEMSEMNGNEKYCYLDDGLPTDSRVPSQIRAGDLILYGADCLVLFYESFSTTYRYTPLGRVEDAPGLADALGSGGVAVSFALESAAGPAPGKEEADRTKEAETMRISVTASGNTVLFELNDSRAAKALYAQLPLTAEIEDFSTNEKVFYPPDKLDTAETPLADAGKGTLAYYAPWGDVVMFYDRFGSGGGLYALGQAVSGEDLIETFSGSAEIAAVE